MSHGPDPHGSAVDVSGDNDPDSDDSCASIFGLRYIIHEFEEIDELSDASSQGGDEITTAERGMVCKWRAENLLTDDLDFAYVFPDFEEAYSYAGRAVAISWSKAKILATPKISSDKAGFDEIRGTAMKIRRIDGLNKIPLTKGRHSKSLSLRQPGHGAGWDEDTNN